MSNFTILALSIRKSHIFLNLFKNTIPFRHHSRADPVDRALVSQPQEHEHGRAGPTHVVLAQQPLPAALRVTAWCHESRELALVVWVQERAGELAWPLPGAVLEGSP